MCVCESLYIDLCLKAVEEMGGKLGKAQQTMNSQKITGQTNGVATNNHREHRSSGDSSKLLKKKKEKTVSKDLVDKSTSTDGSAVVPSSSAIKHLVGYTTHDNLSHDAFTCQFNDSHSSETPSRDVLEFRDACYRRGIISVQFHPVQLIAPEQEEQLQAALPLESREELIRETSVVLVTNIDEVPREEERNDA